MISSISNPINITDMAKAGKYGEITPTSYELALLEKINENRTNSGVEPLMLNATLTWVARAHSQDMIDYDFFDHVSSQAGQFNGATFKERVNDYAEYESGYIGECIAWESWGIEPELVMSRWKNSPSHWDVIINPNFREIGLGLLEGEWDGWPNSGLHTADFGGHGISVDLEISDVDIVFEPASPFEGQDVNISITVKNLGTTDAHPVFVKFYDADPLSGGTLIGTKQVPEILIHGEETVVNLIWDTTGYAGDHDIYVVVDPDNEIAESDEGNNVVSKSIFVNLPNPPIQLNSGWNLISYPYIVQDTKLETVLSSIDGQYNLVQSYISTDINDPWKNYHVSKPSYLNDLKNLDNKIGYWIHIADPSGVSLIVHGVTPSSSQHIVLKEGWNLVGYPSTTIRTRDDALNNLEYGNDVEVIQWYDSANNTYINLDSGEYMEPSYGYFIFTNWDCEWIVNP
jgi:hypothetical protein